MMGLASDTSSMSTFDRCPKALAKLRGSCIQKPLATWEKLIICGQGRGVGDCRGGA